MNKNNNLYKEYHRLISIIHYDPYNQIFDEDMFENLSEDQQTLLIHLSQQCADEIIEEFRNHEK
jgi:TRAP-type C4-dicarboxylate transport system substrate-binding protein